MKDATVCWSERLFLEAALAALIRDQFRQFSHSGGSEECSCLALAVISSYLPEILGLSDRILVSRQGKVVEEFSALEATEEKIMYAAIH